jgi:Xaa-Pro aminopeptidase
MSPPFDSAKLDRLMDDAGVEVVLATSAHNVRYLLDGYRFFFFEHMNAIGVSGYLPCVGYQRGYHENAFYIGNPMEARSLELEPPWVGHLDTSSWTTSGTARAAADALRRLGLEHATIALERSFIPDDARATLEQELPGASFVEALPLLSELRAIKRPDELALLRTVADEIVGAMKEVIGSAEAGVTTRALAERLRIEETRRGLVSEYCLVAAGPSSYRAPSEERWLPGRALSLDSGASLRGYVGDLARMGCMGAPTSRMEELLAEVDAVQRAARAEVRPGRTGHDVYAAALASLGECPDGATMTFVAHGMGLVSHEVPFLTDTRTVPYPAVHRRRPFEPGMVLSIETELVDSVVGYVKLEDTVAVTDSGAEAFGDAGRGWNVVSMQ